LNYIPNIAASTLRKGKNNIIIGVLGYVFRYADTQNLLKFKEALRSLGYNLMAQFMTGEMSDEEKVAYFKEIYCWGAGIAIWTIGIVESSPLRPVIVDLLNQSPPAIGLFSNVPESSIDYVDINWCGDFDKIGNYFKTQGCGSIAIAMHGNDVSDSAMKQNFIKLNSKYGIKIQCFAPNTDSTSYFDAGKWLGKHFLEHPEDIPDGLYCVSDELYFALREFLLAHGMDIASKIMIVATGDTDMNSYLAKPVPYFNASDDWIYLAAKDLVQRIESGEQTPGTQRCVTRVTRDVIIPKV
jgi:DNA-binding LacI/PurR family transcriptional regulator